MTASRWAGVELAYSDWILALAAAASSWTVLQLENEQAAARAMANRMVRFIQAEARCQITTRCPASRAAAQRQSARRWPRSVPLLVSLLLRRAEVLDLLKHDRLAELQVVDRVDDPDGEGEGHREQHGDAHEGRFQQQ